MKFIDLAKETATATGSNSLVLGGAPTGFRVFAPVGGIGYSVGEEVPYKASQGELWEIGRGTKTADGIARTAVTASSNGGAPVNFVAGAIDVHCNASAAFLSSLPQVTTAAFIQAIPLSTPGTSYMEPYTVAGPLTFTAMAGAVQGALVYLRLTADGVNVPSFAAFKEWGGSSGYDNRNGIVNQMQFFYDGTDLFYTASQAVGSVPVAAAANAITMSGPTGGVSGVASSNFTVGASGGTIAGTVVVTPSDGGAGGTFTPVTVSLTSAQPTGTFTYTPASAGAKTISVTNNSSLANPSNITYTATAITAPATMAAPVASAGVGSASIAFVAPANGGAAITSYTVTASTGQTQTGTTSPIVIAMPASVAVTFTITATNSVGTSAASPASNSVTPTAAATAPAQMAAPVATGGNGTVSVAYVAPANGGSAITGYTATWSGGQSVTGTANPLVITGVANGVAGTATMTATNAIGTSPASPASNSVTPTAATSSDLRLTALSVLTESASAPYVYTQTTASGGFGTKGGVLNKKLPAGDGSISLRNVSATEFMLCVPTSAAPAAVENYATCQFVLWAPSASYKIFTNGAAGTVAATLVPQANDIMRLRRSGTTLIAEVARASAPTTFTTIYTWNANVPAGDMAFQINSLICSFDTLAGVGLV